MSASIKNLVRLSDYDIKGQNYYYVERKSFEITKQELHEINIRSGEGYVDKTLTEPLQRANKELKKHGYELYVTDAYRSEELYKLVYKKRKAMEANKSDHKLMNLKKMPHASGFTVDVTLYSLSNGQEVKLRNNEDGPKSAIINFYQNKQDKQSRLYQERQLLLRNTMKKVGFKLGVKNEFWHFEFNDHDQYPY